MSTRGQNTQLQSTNNITPKCPNNIENSLLIHRLTKMDQCYLTHLSDSYSGFIFHFQVGQMIHLHKLSEPSIYTGFFSYKSIYTYISWVLIPLNVSLGTNHIASIQSCLSNWTESTYKIILTFKYFLTVFFNLVLLYFIFCFVFLFFFWYQ